MVLKDARGCGVVLNVPRDVAAQHGLDCEVKSPVARKERADPHVCDGGTGVRRNPGVKLTPGCGIYLLVTDAKNNLKKLPGACTK